MGCRSSKLSPAAELPPALRPVRRKMEEVKKRRRKRSQRYSIVSTELLQPDDTDPCRSSLRKTERAEEEEVAAPAQLAEVKEDEVQYLTSDEGPEEVYVEGSGKKKEIQMGPATKKVTPKAVEEGEEGRKLRAVTAGRGKGGEELPGSPSFRIYFAGPIRDPVDNPVSLEQPKCKAANGTDELSVISKSRVAHTRS